MACVVFPAVLTTVTSVTFAAAVSFAHDVFGRGKRYRTHTGEVRALRVAAVIVCAVGLSLATAIHDSGGSAALPRPKILNSTFGTWNTES